MVAWLGNALENTRSKTGFQTKLHPHMNVFRLLALAALLTLSGLSLSAASRPPNIIIIFTDDQGYADVGVFGAKGFTTPNLDRMAAEGRKFTNFHVPQPVCSASRAGLLTGCYPNRIGIHGALGPNARHGIADTEMTLAQLVKQKGYSTGMAGKWHLGHHPQFLPTHHGFDEYFGLPYSNDMWPLHPDAKPGSYPPLPMIEGDQVIKLGLGHEEQSQLTTQYTERAVKFIEKNKDRPFFFYLAHNMPHVPLHVSSKFKGKSAQGLYSDVIMEIDWSVGEILKTLKQHKLDENTLVIFTSDNGPWLSYGNHAGSASPLREGKGTHWEGGTREPCIMRWPGHIPAGTTSDGMLMTIDLFPTLAKLISADLPKHTIDGLDVWPLIVGTPGAKNPHAGYYGYYENNQLQSVTSGDGRWKLQVPHVYRTLAGRPGGTNGVPARYEQRKLDQPELYDLQTDLGETRNVAGEHPEIVQRLLALAEQARVDLGDSLTQRTGKGVREPGRLPESAAVTVTPPQQLRLATFDLDVTPPLGSIMAYDPVVRVAELGLRCRGVALLGAGEPIVLCAVDWIGIGNEASDAFREALAQAAGTKMNRVTVHALHQHDAPAFDLGAERILKEAGLPPGRWESSFARDAMLRAAAALQASLTNSQPVTHVGFGSAKVEKVASNRRIMGPDGRVRAVRYTATKDPALRAEPEGVIDPNVDLVSFWNGGQPVAVLSYYACHPQSYYRTGVPSPDFPGIARFMRGQAVPEALHVHFNGAGGNIGAGKYNDGSKENRLILAQRLADGMKRAWESTRKSPLTSADVAWRFEQVALPPAKHLDDAKLSAELLKVKSTPFLGPADVLSFLRRCQAGHLTEIACLSLGEGRVLHLPGELFVEYQLAAKALRPDLRVSMAAYGDYGPAYIGTAKAYEEGGYETEPRSSNVSPEVEGVLMGAIQRLLTSP